MTYLASWFGDLAQSPVLWVAGLVTSALIVGVIAWARLRPVHVPRIARFPQVPTIGVELGAVDLSTLVDALAVLTDLGHRLGPPPLRARADIMIRVWDPSLVDEHGGETVAGLTRRESDDTGRILRADIWLHPSAGVTVTAHELLHAIGYAHPTAAPTGHLMHPHRSRQSTTDVRGLEGP